MVTNEALQQQPEEQPDEAKHLIGDAAPPVVAMAVAAPIAHPLRYEITWSEIGKKVIPWYLSSALFNTISFVFKPQQIAIFYFLSTMSALSNHLIISRTGFSFFYHRYLKQHEGALPHPPFDSPVHHNQVKLVGLQVFIGMLAAIYIYFTKIMIWQDAPSNEMVSSKNHLQRFEPSHMSEEEFLGSYSISIPLFMLLVSLMDYATLGGKTLLEEDPFTDCTYVKPQLRH